ncbi:MAG TPA: hypothetical protein VGL18_17135 [Actinomycetota bacterium]
MPGRVRHALAQVEVVGPGPPVGGFQGQREGAQPLVEALPDRGFLARAQRLGTAELFEQPGHRLEVLGASFPDDGAHRPWVALAYFFR